MGAPFVAARVLEYPKLMLDESFVLLCWLAVCLFRRSLTAIVWAFVSSHFRDNALDVLANVSIYGAFVGALIECVVLMCWRCHTKFCILACRTHFWILRCVLIATSVTRLSHLGYEGFAVYLVLCDSEDLFVHFSEPPSQLRLTMRFFGLKVSLFKLCGQVWTYQLSVFVVSETVVLFQCN